MNYEMNQTITGNSVYHMENASLTYYDLKAGYICEYNTYNKIRLIAVFSGTVEYTFSMEEVCQSNRNLFLLPPYSQLHLHVIDQARLMVLEVDDAMIKSIYRNVRERQPFNAAIEHPKPYIQITFNHTLYDCIQKIHSEYAKNKENPYLVELNVCRLIYTLLCSETSSYLFSIKASHPMEQVIYFIQRHIRDAIRISDLADLAGMNRSNFTNTFKRHFGKTPLEYIQSVKMQYAEELLKDHSVTDVAFELGYENVSSFISVFKKIYNVTPKQYQLLDQVS